MSTVDDREEINAAHEEYMATELEAIPQNRKKKRQITLDTILNFGRHKGEQFEDMIIDQPEYVSWMLREGVAEYDKETSTALQKAGLLD